MLIGFIIKPHGLRGEVKVKLIDPQSEAIRTSEVLCVKSDKLPIPPEWMDVLRVKSTKGNPERVVTLKGIDTIEMAERLRGRSVYMRRSSLPPLDPNEFYEMDVMGLHVVDDTGKRYGQVAEVVLHSVVPVVRVEKDGQLVGFIPLDTAHVLSVNVREKTLTIQSGVVHETDDHI